MKYTEYIILQKQIFIFSKEYCNAIDKIDNITGNRFAKVLFTILFYPAIFMLKYNAMKRVTFLCSLFIMRLTLNTKYYRKKEVDKIISFKANFTDTYDPLKIVTLIMTFTSSSIIISIILYLIQSTIFLDLIPTAAFSIFLVMGFNYVQYNSWRGNLKLKFSEIKNKIYIL